MTVPADGGPVLLGLARGAIARRLSLPAPAVDAGGAWLAEPAPTFVTLTCAGRLRGCVGSLTAVRPLREDVTANARNAAFHDPRFAPVRADEVDALRIEVSLLGPHQPLPASSREDALARLRPGVDGLVLAWRDRRATFLPQVWGQLPDPDAFLRHLALKAGLPADFWDADVRLAVYSVTSWEEDGDEARP